ncbi:MAG TPA: hypothetical protein VD908_21585 [Cytophagales bacterium]|nr:hypothetical protein [Cytophagales bacterium]
MEIEEDLYYKNILRKIEDYQKGEIPLDELKRIPKADLLQAMREECHRISIRVKDLNKELNDSNSLKNLS